MNKYLSIATTAGTELIPIGEGLFAVFGGATAVDLVAPSGVEYNLTTVDATFLLIDAINAALTEASQTNWRDTIHPVALPTGETVDTIAVSLVA